jgi:hypothetical protein
MKVNPNIDDIIKYPVIIGVKSKVVSARKYLRGFSGYVAYSNGAIYSLYAKRFVSLRKRKDGYMQICLHGKMALAHRVTAKSFLETVKDKPFVNHKNGIKTDNRIENLEWVSAKENIIHARITGLNVQQYGFNAPAKKLSRNDIAECHSMYISGKTAEEIANKFNVNPATVRNNLRSEKTNSEYILYREKAKDRCKKGRSRRWS